MWYFSLIASFSSLSYFIVLFTLAYCFSFCLFYLNPHFITCLSVIAFSPLCFPLPFPKSKKLHYTFLLDSWLPCQFQVGWTKTMKCRICCAAYTSNYYKVYFFSPRLINNFVGLQLYWEKIFQVPITSSRTKIVYA